MKKPMAVEIQLAETTIKNGAQHPEVRARLLAAGVPAQTLDAGDSLVKTARSAMAEQDRQRSAKQDQTGEQKKTAQALRLELRDLIRAVGRAYPDANDNTLSELGLTDGVPHAQAKLLATAQTAATNLESSTRKALISENGFGPARIAALGPLATQFGEAMTAQDGARGGALGATRRQRAALDALRAWRLKVVGLAEDTLRDSPDLLAGLGDG